MLKELEFTGDFGPDCQIVWDNMLSLKLDTKDYAADRGIYRMYFSFTYREKKYQNIKSFYNPEDEVFSFLPFADEMGLTEYEWSIVQNVIAIVTKKEYDL